MEMAETRKTYSEYKKELDTEMEKAAEGFVRIGYLLKVARDTQILAESGYGSVAEFAKAEYGLDKTQVSRFIRINDRFSEGGCSDRLLPEYRGFGHAKLTLMLSLPDEINAELTADYTKAEIQGIKEAVEAEKKTTDIELMLEERQPVQADGIPQELAEFAHAACRDTRLFEGLYDAESGSVQLSVTEVLAPEGKATLIARIPGKGRYTLFITGESASLCSVRNPQEKQSFPVEMVERAFSVPHGGSVQEAYERAYGEPWPDTPPEPERKTKVVTTEPHRAEPEKKEPEKEDQPEPEEQLPGQQDITDYPEALPEKIPEEDTEVLPPVTENAGQPEGSRRVEDRESSLEEQGSSPAEDGTAETSRTPEDGLLEATEKANRERALSHLESASAHLKNWIHADTIPYSVLDLAAEQAEAGYRILDDLRKWKGDGEYGTE